MLKTYSLSSPLVRRKENQPSLDVVSPFFLLGSSSFGAPTCLPFFVMHPYNLMQLFFLKNVISSPKPKRPFYVHRLFKVRRVQASSSILQRRHHRYRCLGRDYHFAHYNNDVKRVFNQRKAHFLVLFPTLTICFTIRATYMTFQTIELKEFDPFC